ncbi:hypothetical protein CONPUDRAFT_69099 [Coniophora puteana RWD-64-598 SS2]|uniref:Uncharacterized protein n=1 Tax=Coniophora puteana (strain RWD-64-598) TaxID=741705 RepID=A0A5M3N5Q1_CONPW|nr:uncharacterized protein CONPUDRAFT_69099 [Coniophora puteana RWD-64-598 SS2]EIW86648.1 hypothetical protein CONPUDRAFT_69099 [Coniophora puteana RWD-64-598 SS2]
MAHALEDSINSTWVASLLPHFSTWVASLLLYISTWVASLSAFQFASRTAGGVPECSLGKGVRAGHAGRPALQIGVVGTWSPAKRFRGLPLVKGVSSWDTGAPCKSSLPLASGPSEADEPGQLNGGPRLMAYANRLLGYGKVSWGWCPGSTHWAVADQEENFWSGSRGQNPLPDMAKLPLIQAIPFTFLLLPAVLLVNPLLLKFKEEEEKSLSQQDAYPR